MTTLARTLALALVASSSLLAACAAEPASDPSALTPEQAAFDEQHGDLPEADYIRAWNETFGAGEAIADLEAGPRCLSKMPKECLGGLNDWEVTVKTGSQKYAGTDSRIDFRVRFLKPNGTQAYSAWQQLDQDGIDNFERSHTDVFQIFLTNIGIPNRIELRSDGSGDNEGWFVNSVELTDICSGGSWNAAFGVWLEEGGVLSASRTLACN